MKQCDASNQEQFYDYFRLKVSGLQEQIASLQDKSLQENDTSSRLEGCLADITRLQREVQDSTSYTAAYDQRVYTEGIRTLQEKLDEARAVLVPKPKFSFKSRIKKKQQMSSSREPIEPDRIFQSSQGGLKCDFQSPSGAIAQPRHGTSHGLASFNVLNVSSQAQSMITVPVPEGQDAQSASLVDLQRCVVSIGAEEASLANIAVQAVGESLLMCGHVEGSAHVTSVQDSVLVVSALQFRMHDCRNCAVYLNVRNAPVIEDCSEIRFAPLPFLFVSASAPSNGFEQMQLFRKLTTCI